MLRARISILVTVAGSVWFSACAQPASDGVSVTNPTSASGPMPAVALDAGLGPSAAGPAAPANPGVMGPSLGDGSAPVYTIDPAKVGFEDGGCGASAIEAKQVVIKDERVVEEKIDEVQPVALYIMLDHSQSMQMAGLWAPAKEALKGFVSDPSSAGIDVALELFPDDAFLFDPTGLSEQLGLFPICDGSQNDVAMVPMGRLPGHAAAFTQGLDARPNATGLGTPIETALRGAATFCSRFEQSSMGEECVAVLLTDGAPSGCAQDTAALVQLAQTIYAGGMGTRLFTVGLQGADFALLDALAQAGGAVDCDANSERFSCDVSGGPDQLRNAMQKIRNVVTKVTTRVETTTRVMDIPVECEWTVPALPNGGMFDKKRVNVRVSAPSLKTPLDFGQVDSAAACVEKGWHYDNPDAPTRLIACPETCTMLKATPLAKVDILLGCETVTLK